MKLKYSILALFAAAATLFGCVEEADHYLSEIKVSTSYVSLPATGGSATFTIDTEGPWQLDNIYTVSTGEKDANGKDITAPSPVPAWLTVSPTSGAAGENITITVSAEAPEARRETMITILCNGKAQNVNIIQEAEVAEKPELPITPLATVIAEASGNYRVRGTVTKVVNEQYGNFYIIDDSYTGPNFQIYGTKNEKGQYPKDAAGGWASFGIEAGDIVTVEGPYSLYGTTHELVDVSVIKVEKSLIDVEDFDFETLPAEAGTFEMNVSAKVSPLLVTTDADWLKVSDIGADGQYILSYEANTRTATRTATITIKGPGAMKTVSVSQVGVPPSGATVTEVIAMDDDSEVELLESTTVAKTTRGIVISDGESALYVYGSKVDDVKVGDNLKVWARKTTYNGVPELVFDSSNEVHAIDVISSGNAVSHPDAKDITAAALTYEASEAEFVKLSGTLKVSGNYLNMALDGVEESVKMGSIVYPVDELNAKSFDGKKITVTGYFNGLSSAGRYINIIATKISEYVDNPKGTITNPYSASELAQALLGGETFDTEVYARGIINKIDSISWDETLGDKYYGNAQYWLSDDGTTADLEVYRGFYYGGAKFTAENQIKVGDEVLVCGKVKLYVSGDKKTPEFDTNNYIVTINGKGAATGDGTAENPYSVTALVDMLLAGETPAAAVYGKGIISKIDSVSWDTTLGEKYYGNAQYWISDDGTTAYQMEVYRGFYFGGAKFTAEDQIKVGDEVVVYGKVKLYVSGDKKTPEFDANNYIVSLNGATE